MIIFLQTFTSDWFVILCNNKMEESWDMKASDDSAVIELQILNGNQNTRFIIFLLPHLSQLARSILARAHLVEAVVRVVLLQL